MLSAEYNFEEVTLRRRLLTILQHKLRRILKCYTIVNFQLNEDNTFSFSKSYKRYGVRINDSTVNTGKLEIRKKNDDDENVILKIYVD
jgi:hypothetical protein